MGKVEATEEQKAALTKASQNAVNLSLSLPVQALPAAESLAMSIQTQLDNAYFPFQDSGGQVENVATNVLLGPVIGLWRAATRETWSSSQTIRANCQAARINVRNRREGGNRTLIGQQRDVSLLDETTSNVASREFVDDVRKRVEECARNPLKCTTDPTANLWIKFWNSVPLSAKLVGGAALTGMFLFYFGPLIRAGDTVAAKLVSRKRKRHKK